MFDLIVIGAGPGGYEAAIRAAQLGMKVLVVEKDAPGGTCLNIGCIPTKTLYKDAQVIGFFAHAADYGVRCQGFEADLALAQARKEKVVETLVSGVAGLLKANGIEYVKGTARLAGKTRVEVALAEGGQKSFEGRRILLATGSHNAAPPVPGLDLPGVITSTEALSLTKAPKHMVIIGGGVIGIEFAGIYSAFGSQVTVVEFMPSILPTMDAELAKRLKMSLAKQGITILESTQCKRVEKAAGGLKVSVEGKKGADSIECDSVLVATGRLANVEGLGLEALGVAFDKKGVKVDENYETSVKGIYAIGDVTGRVQLAHVASEEGIVCVERMHGEAPRVDYDVIPSAVFTFPELASVGLTEEQLKEKGLAYKVGKSGFVSNGKALSMNQNDGLVKVLASEDLSQIYGVHILGPNASDILTEAVAAIHGMFTVEEAAQMMHGHPTLSEVFMEAVNGLLGKSIHAMPAKKK